MLDAALRLHRAGWWVVPQVGKRAVALGWQDFRLAEADLHEYLGGGREMNIALVLNQSAVIDVECDSPEAEAELVRLCGGAVPRTPTWRSRRGLHRLFARPDAADVPDKSKVELNGIEFRLGMGPKPGALSTVPPSVSPDDPACVYRWLLGRSVFDCPPAPLPAPLADLLRKARRSRTAARAAEWTGDAIPEGHRNDELFRMGCRALRTAGPGEIAALLHGANKLHCAPPLPDAEVDAVVASVETTAERAKTDIVPRRCTTWAEVRAAWADALEMRPSIEEVLAIMLAVATSTSQGGKNQLFLQVVGSPGSGKTELCQGLLVSPGCKRVERLNGIFSGMKDFDDPSKDYSFLGRANHKCWVTPEMDLLMSAPGYAEVMSQMRRVFDGSASATYKNRDHDMEYNGLRTPWIQAGTHAMVDRRQASLGDRFLRVYVDEPDADTKRRILRKVGMTELDAMMVESNCSPESGVPPRLLRAYQLTGGYVDWLRANATPRLRALRYDPEHLLDWCTTRADFVAHMRSCPPDLHFGREPDYHATKELPSRLQGQFVRLAMHLAVALQRPGPDAAVLRIVRRVALDTAKGRALNMTERLAAAGPDGICPDTLAHKARESDPNKVKRWLAHMGKVGVVARLPGAAPGMPQKWSLTPHMTQLYTEVYGNGG